MLHYFRGERQMSLRKTGNVLTRRTILAIGMLVALPVWSQYPGQVTKTATDVPILRAVGVLEWTGDFGKPKKSRLVPITVYDGEALQDGGVYLARPEPLALASEVEYELERNGRTVGLFDIMHSGQEQGSWVGFGSWKALPVAVPKREAAALSQHPIDDEGGDRPVLHRKAHAGDTSGSGTGSGSGGNSGSSAPAPASDPDRPTLHKKTSTDDTGNTSSGTTSTTSTTSSTTPSTGSSTSSGSSTSTSSGSTTSPASDPDRPTLHKKTSSDDSASAPASTSDRTTLKEGKKKQPEDIGHVESLPSVTDPDRPRLKRGKYDDTSAPLAPSLIGLPGDMQQTVAVSDTRNQPDHPWSYTWANPDDEAKMKAAMEDLARNALGLTPPPPPPAPAHTGARKKAKTTPATPPPPAPLMDQEFRVFELAYGSGATLVFSARTDGPVAQQKFVTLVAQPDLYGDVMVLLKSVTDSAHLDETPRMHLVDAVDALADNRGELLFELRGATQRQFALYRVLRGQAEKLFETGGAQYGAGGGI
jgi:hypothetical protein